MLKELFRWRQGRQQTGYEKMFLGGAYWPIPFDIYLLRFRQGTEIKRHKDEVENGRHFRINIILKHASAGGNFICEDPIFQSRSIKLFRPDISEHEVTRIESGKRYVLSVGWVLKQKRAA